MSLIVRSEPFLQSHAATHVVDSQVNPTLQSVWCMVLRLAWCEATHGLASSCMRPACCCCFWSAHSIDSVEPTACDTQGNSQMMTAIRKARKASSATLSSLTLPGTTSAVLVTTSSRQTHCPQVAPLAAVASQVSNCQQHAQLSFAVLTCVSLCSHSSNGTTIAISVIGLICCSHMLGGP